jgi:hypothetical protein
VTGPSEAAQALNELLGDEPARAASARAARRVVLREHSYRERMIRIAQLAGFPVPDRASAAVAVAAVADSADDVASIAALLENQELAPAEVIVGHAAGVDPGALARLEQGRGVRRLRLVDQAPARARSERLAELGRLVAAPWVFICSPSLEAGPQFMLDLFLATQYAEADVIGSPAAGAPQQYCDAVDPRGFLISQAALAEHGAPGDDASFRALFRAGVRVFAAERPLENA